MSAQRTNFQPVGVFAAVMAALLVIEFPQQALWLVDLPWTGIVRTAEFVHTTYLSPVFSLLADFASWIF